MSIREGKWPEEFSSFLKSGGLTLGNPLVPIEI